MLLIRQLQLLAGSMSRDVKHLQLGGRLPSLLLYSTATNEASAAAARATPCLFGLFLVGTCTVNLHLGLDLYIYAVR
jgi:hypothetical protein